MDATNPVNATLRGAFMGVIGSILLVALPLAMGAGGQGFAPQVDGQGAGANGNPLGNQAAGGWMGFSSMTREGHQLLTIVDTQRQTLAVYSVHFQSGQVSLRSVRRLTYDLSMEGYNLVAPMPQEMRQMAQRMGEGLP
jgi:hypothetical protein